MTHAWLCPVSSSLSPIGVDNDKNNTNLHFCSLCWYLADLYNSFHVLTLTDWPELGDTAPVRVCVPGVTWLTLDTPSPAPSPTTGFLFFFWPTFDRWPSFVCLSRGCFSNGESIALVFDQSLAFVCSSVTWLLPQWRKHRIGLRLIVGFRLFVCHVAASPMAKALH